MMTNTLVAPVARTMRSTGILGKQRIWPSASAATIESTMREPRGERARAMARWRA
jgi:hypothetical protein